MNRILVIDDDPTNFDVIETCLAVGEPPDGIPFHLSYAANGEDAIAALDQYQPDVILLDVMMPGMNGMDVCRVVKAMPKWQPVPIIIVTALADKEDLAQCMAAGADDFVSKPIHGVELRARVQSMLRLKRQYDRLQQLLLHREDMAQMIVHDLRNPLTNILFGLELIEKIDYSRPQQQERLARIRASGQHLQALIDDILVITKIESGKLKLVRGEIQLSTLIQAVVNGFQELIEQKKLEVIQEIPSDLTLRAVDVTLFRRVLDNLVSNAIKFSPAASRIVVSAQDPDPEHVLIQVVDSGVGVPETLQQQIFEKYETGTYMEGVSQLGLGLAFCKMVVEHHGGEIRVRPHQPQGAVFEGVMPNLPQPSP